MGTDYEVVIPTRGDDIKPVLAGLIQHAPFDLRIVTDKLPNQDPEAIVLLETLRHLGCHIVIQMQWEQGVWQARRQSALTSDHLVVISLDDDVVLSPNGSLEKLAAAALGHPFASPVIRWGSNWIESTLEGHQEIWEQINDDDPRLWEVLKARGPDWVKCFDTGHDNFTNDLSGNCYAVRSELYREVAQKMTPDLYTGMDDHWIGKQLGTGIVLSGVHLYHFGFPKLKKWGFHSVGMRLLHYDPELYFKLARPTNRE